MSSALRCRTRLPRIQFFSSSARMPIIIPSDLTADIRTWTLDHVKQFIEANKDQCQLDNHSLRVFNEQRINGASLLKLEVKELYDVGVMLGTARGIVDLVNALKKDKGLIEPGLLSESDFLKLCPPSLSYIHRSKKISTTIPAHYLTPLSVVPWDGFKDEVNNVIWDDTPKYSHPVFMPRREISDEDTLRGALDFNVFLPLSTILGPDEQFVRHSSSNTVIGEPDFIQQDVKQVLRLAIEAKTKWALFVNDLGAAYAQSLAKRQKRGGSKTLVYHQIRQIFGYLSYNELRFGSLTTYDKTWFLYRPPKNPGQLCVSPPIQYNNQQPTLFQCFSYLTFLARKGHACASAPPFLPPPDDDKGGSSYGDGGSKRKISSRRGRLSKGSRERSTLMGCRRSRMITSPSRPLNREKGCTPLDFFDWGSFKVFDVLGNGRTGKVFKAILHGEMVALKLCDLWQHPDYKGELLNEVKVYHALKDLQGDCIPKLKGAGYTAGGLFAIATDIVGKPLEYTESLSDEECLAIRRALSNIHCHGFIHNDIRLDNILIKRDAHQFHVSIIDFAFSKRGCQQDFREEMEELICLLN